MVNIRSWFMQSTTKQTCQSILIGNTNNYVGTQPGETQANQVIADKTELDDLKLDLSPENITNL